MRQEVLRGSDEQVGTAQAAGGQGRGCLRVGLLLWAPGPFQLGFPLSQLEAALRDKSQQLEGLQELKVTLEEQLKKETAAKVMWRREHRVAWCPCGRMWQLGAVSPEAIRG